MRSNSLVTAGGIAALVGAIALLLEGVLTLSNHTLGTLGDVVVLAALVLAAVGGALLCMGLFWVDGPEQPTEPAPLES